MADWTTNTIMLWSGNKISDHGRQPLNMSTQRIGTDKRMADGTLRRMNIAVKRLWSVNWENLPSTNRFPTGFKTADGGWSGEQMETFYYNTPGRFRMVLKRGSASGLAVPAGASTLGPKFEDNNFYGVDVMLTDFSKEVRKRGGKSDFWNVAVTLEEV
jgi:hypothetical protein